MSILRSLLVAGLSLTTMAMLPAQEAGQRRDAAGRDQVKGDQANRDETGRNQKRDQNRDQNRDQPGRTDAKAGTRTEVRAAGQEGRGSNQLDKFFVSCLRADNKGEVTIATLGSQKASNPDVKAFAQQMVKEHTEFLAKLDRFDQSSGAGGTSSTTIRKETRESTTRDSNRPDATNRDTPRNDANRDNARKDGTNRDAQNDAKNRDNARPRDRAEATARSGVQVDVNRTDTTTHTAVHGSGDIAQQITQIKQEISEKCVASAQRELNSKEGQEFDKCFVGMQIGGHMRMVDTLTVLSSRASPELQQILDEGLQTSQQHLEHAKQLAKKLEESSSNASERSGERATNRSGNADRNPEKAK